MNNPSLENDYVIVCKYAFEHLSCGIYGDLSIFSSISGKVPHVASFNPIRRHIARFSQKKKKKKKRKCARLYKNGPESFIRWLNFFWVSFDNEMKKIKKFLLHNY